MPHKIERSLQGKGYRLTASRKKLIEIFTSNIEEHYDFDNLMQLTGEGNISTMYNNLEVLINEKIVKEFYVGSTKFFEYNGNIHGHFICTTCHQFYNVDVPGLNCLDVLIKNKYNYLVHDSKIEFFGCCNQCKELKCHVCKNIDCKHNATHINIVNQYEYQFDEIEINGYVKYLEVCMKQLGKELSIVFVSNDKIQELNQEFRNINKVTDVLTFVDGQQNYLGDIIICYPQMLIQAKEYNHSIKRELLFLITHGYLHLLGYDHLDEKEEKEMNIMQEKLLAEYGVNRDEKL